GHAAPDSGPGTWLSQNACLEAIGFTDWNRYDILSGILDRMEQAPFTGQLDHWEKIAALRRQIDQIRPASKPSRHRPAVKILRELVSRRPTDPDLRSNLAGLLDLLEDHVGAEEQWREVLARSPHNPSACFNLAELLAQEGRLPEAVIFY